MKSPQVNCSIMGIFNQAIFESAEENTRYYHRDTLSHALVFCQSGVFAEFTVNYNMYSIPSGILPV